MKKLINYLEKVMNFYAGYFTCTNHTLSLFNTPAPAGVSHWHVPHSFLT